MSCRLCRLSTIHTASRVTARAALVAAIVLSAVGLVATDLAVAQSVSAGELDQGPATEPVSYVAPVDVPVVDPFRPPANPYGAGNRGLEYATAAGTEVRAAADGTVSFAGLVAGSSWITIAHADGVRTAYGPLLSVSVTRGESVARGDVVGTSGERLMFTARLGDTYLDPAALLASGPSRVHLIPDGQPASAASSPSLLSLTASRFAGVTGDAGWLAGAMAWARGAAGAIGAQSLHPFGLAELDPVPNPLTLANAAIDWWQRQKRCTPAEDAAHLPARRRVAVLVAGLGSSSDRAAVDRLDVRSRGYLPGDTLRFSYAGGFVAGPASPDLVGCPSPPTRPPTPLVTWPCQRPAWRTRSPMSSPGCQRMSRSTSSPTAREES
jgi:Peptidase family M23